MISPPPEGTVERWAWDYVLSRELATKLAPPPLPSRWEESPPPRRIDGPGRPPELRPTSRAEKTPRPGALRDPKRRIQIFHTFFHHEIQAAELMAWAALAFPDAPAAFRRGLFAIALDEVRHANLYADHVAKLGGRVGDHDVRDWFWERIPAVTTPASFVAAMGVGLEGANLDHAPRFAASFDAAGDREGAAVQRLVASDEETHVAFAARWLAKFTGAVDFDAWAALLPPPMSPLVLKGPTMERASRRRGGLPDDFLDRLERWTCDPRRSR